MFALGTKPNKNIGLKKNRLMIGLSAKDINFNYSINIEIMTAVLDHIFL